MVNGWQVSSTMLVNKLFHLVYIEYNVVDYKVTYLQWIFFHHCIIMYHTLMTPTLTALDNVYTLVFIFMQALASCFCPVYADKKLHEQQQQHVY